MKSLKKDIWNSLCRSHSFRVCWRNFFYFRLKNRQVKGIYLHFHPLCLKLSLKQNVLKSCCAKFRGKNVFCFFPSLLLFVCNHFAFVSENVHLWKSALFFLFCPPSRTPAQTTGSSWTSACGTSSASSPPSALSRWWSSPSECLVSPAWPSLTRSLCWKPPAWTSWYVCVSENNFLLSKWKLSDEKLSEL